MAPTFLTLDEALALHADQIRRYGGSPGLRDRAGLESALAVPQATFDGELLYPTLPEMAAAYLFHLARNHPFVDGNKPTALAATLAFLWLNDCWLEADDDDLYDLVLNVAEGGATKAETAAFLHTHQHPLS